VKLVDDIARLSQILTKWKELTRGAEIAKGRDAPRIIMDTLRTRRTLFTGENARTRFIEAECAGNVLQVARNVIFICLKTANMDFKDVAEFKDATDSE
jgi:hypothetical protein